MKRNQEKIIREINPDEVELLAQAYVTAFAEEAWGETHDIQNLKTKIKDWITSENYQVKIAYVNDEFAGFAITRLIPGEQVIDDLCTELREVSNISLSDNEQRQLHNQLNTLSNGKLEDFASMVGIFQDIVVTKMFRGTSTYIDLMYLMTVDLLKHSSLSLIVVYTNPRVKTVVRTLEALGGTLVYGGSDIVIYAATKQTIINKLASLNLFSKNL